MERTYKSLTYGVMTEEQVFKNVLQTLQKSNNYEVYVGTDSQVYDETKVALVIVLYNKGQGGRFFWSVDYEKIFHTLRERMYHEAEQSIETAKRLMKYLFDNDLEFNIVIDVDLGRKGKTADLVNEITGYVVAEGFEVRYKPYSVAASTIADKFSK